MITLNGIQIIAILFGVAFLLFITYGTAQDIGYSKGKQHEFEARHLLDDE